MRVEAVEAMVATATEVVEEAQRSAAVALAAGFEGVRRVKEAGAGLHAASEAGRDVRAQLQAQSGNGEVVCGSDASPTGKSDGSGSAGSGMDDFGGDTAAAHADADDVGTAASVQVPTSAPASTAAAAEMAVLRAQVERLRAVARQAVGERDAAVRCAADAQRQRQALRAAAAEAFAAERALAAKRKDASY
eukprot:3309248-Pleurochrysis_carterae.AAC.1